MNHVVYYSCLSHVGKCRKINQDNFICGRRYMEEESCPVSFPITGCLSEEDSPVVGIFDGMGGEECGETASLLAAREASSLNVTDRPVDDLLLFCHRANERICQYAKENGISSMGTTAALLAFADQKIALCNIGDSKIFCFADHKLEQLSVDHVAFAPYGMKPLLYQNLGIPSSEMTIDPYAAARKYHDKDLYLICSDGLTDMVPPEEISGILSEVSAGLSAGRAGKNSEEASVSGLLAETTVRLLEKALAGGGRDNITVILCKIEKRRKGFLKRLLRKAPARGGSV